MSQQAFVMQSKVDYKINMEIQKTRIAKIIF